MDGLTQKIEAARNEALASGVRLAGSQTLKAYPLDPYLREMLERHLSAIRVWDAALSAAAQDLVTQ